MLSIGIDMSINYTAICQRSETDIHYDVYLRNLKKQTKRSQACIKLMEATGQFGVYVLPDEPSCEIEDAINLAELIMESFGKFDGVVNVAIEGFAFQMSNSSSLSKLIGYQYILREYLFKIDQTFSIYPPTTIKKTAGKGTFNKEKMIQAYLENADVDDVLAKCKIRKLVLDDPSQFKNTPGTKWLKPFEDCVDAYWAARTIQNNN